MAPLAIGVVGCGVAGQAAAILAAGDGHDVTLFERFPTPRPVGAGLLLQATGQRALQRLGLLDGARALGERIDGIDAHTRRGRVVLHLRYETLAPGMAGLGIHRGALFQLLHDRLRATPTRLELGVEIAGIEETARPRLRLADGGARGPFDVLLVADGAHSALRAAHAPRHAARLYPWGCLWATVPDPEGRFAGRLRQRVRDTRVMLGALPVGRRPGDPEAAREVTLFWSLPVAAMDACRARGLDALKADMRAEWPDLAGPLERVASFDQLSMATYRDVRLSRWRAGRAVFIGDAAHGTSPQLGQGANMALLDALALTTALRQRDGDGEAAIDAALDRAEAWRRPHTDAFGRISQMLTPFYQSRLAPLGWARDLAFGPFCALPPTRNLMLSVLGGVRRGWIGRFPMAADGMPELPY
ncbi:MAG: FAD-dependent monooxygenase [Rhodospirillales bacterium]|nr:FAD-dependent monooxygenase [Rhodospirillales bacterium]